MQNPNNSLAAFYIEPNGLRFDFIRAPANNGVAPLAPAPSWEEGQWEAHWLLKNEAGSFLPRRRGWSTFRGLGVFCWRRWGGGKVGICRFCLSDSSGRALGVLSAVFPAELSSPLADKPETTRGCLLLELLHCLNGWLLALTPNLAFCGVFCFTEEQEERSRVHKH